MANQVVVAVRRGRMLFYVGLMLFASVLFGVGAVRAAAPADWAMFVIMGALVVLALLRARAFFRRYHWLAEAPPGLANLLDSSETE